jgi:hypothetical protein
MSKPVTQAEVEDVLSSIRRLVDDTKQGPVSNVAPTAGNRLLLTPQLRVDMPDVFVLKSENEVTPVAPVQDAPRTEPQAVSDPGKQSDVLVLRAENQAPPLRTDVSELSAKIAALEKAIAQTADQWEPDGAGRDAYAGTQSPTMHWQEDVELDATGRPMRAETVEKPNAQIAPEVPDARRVPEAAEDVLEEALEEQVIDEETLRQMVAQIVRDELQGPLGERITRNVRKLVRREIHRALVVQTLE